MLKLADLIVKYRARLADVESMDNGKPYKIAHDVDLHFVIWC